MKRGKLFGLCLGISLILVFTEPPFLPAWGAPPTGELRIGVSTLYTETFHPYRALPGRKFYLDTMYDYLVGINENMKLDSKLGVAYKWEEARDHLSWTFYIRNGVRFHDGTPLTLEDVKYSLDTMMDEKNTIARPEWKPHFDRVEILPPNKVVFYLKKPHIFVPYNVSPISEGCCVILPKKYIEEKGVEYFETHPMGTGPYKFLEKKEGDYIKFVAQDSHWRIGTPKYRYLTFKVMPEEGTRAAALQAGEVGLIQVSIATAKRLEAQGFPTRVKNNTADMNLIFLRLYEKDNPLSKKKVREALVYAIDKASIVKHVLLGMGKPMGHTAFMFSTSLCYKEYPLIPYDPKRAKQLLAEAGYPNGFTIYFYSFVTADLPEQKLVNETIAGYWKAIGMDVKILEMDYAAARPYWQKLKEPAGPAALTFCWPSKIFGTWYPIFGSDTKSYQFSQIQDPEMDRLIEKLNQQVTVEEFIEAERKCEEWVMSNFYNAGITSVSALFSSRKEVPAWALGKNAYSYRFEYIGATK